VPPVAAAALLPGAIANLLDAGATFQHVAIAPDGPAALPRTLAQFWTQLAAHPAAPSVMKLLSVFDIFSFWTALLVGFGLIAAGHVPQRRALAGTLIAWLCLRLLTQVAAGGHCRDSRSSRSLVHRLRRRCPGRTCSRAAAARAHAGAGHPAGDGA